MGITLCGIGAIVMALSVAWLEPFFLSIMGPVAICAFGLALVSPYVVTVGMAPFPHIAGSASALTGFLQMAGGFVGGFLAASLGDPLTAFGIIIPAMEIMACAAFLWLTYLLKHQKA